MKETFIEHSFKPETLRLIRLCNQIIAQYQAMGLRLTLRQLYYQLVSRNAIRNEEASYKNLGRVVSDGRLAGLIDWAAIEDRLRLPHLPLEFEDLTDLVEAAVASYRLPRWRDHDSYVELWVEKDALAGVLAPLAAEYHVTLMVNRGYSSQSAMYDAFGRFWRAIDAGKIPTLFYLGDHDPSGEDMVRDIAARLTMFLKGEEVEVTKIALTMNQVSTYNPPPNPTKMTDSRARGYVANFGHQSWEVDALPPDVLAELIRASLDSVVDQGLLEAVKERETEDKAKLRAAVKVLVNGE